MGGVADWNPVSLRSRRTCCGRPPRSRRSPDASSLGPGRHRLTQSRTVFQPAEETRGRTALEALQLERLRGTIARMTTHTAAYRRHLGGVTASDLASVDDLQRLPFLTKEQLRDGYPYGMACHGPEPIRRVHMSSGTTGAPVVNPYTAADVGQWREVMARALVAASVTAADVMLVTATFGLFTGGFGFQFGADAL